MRRFQSVGRVAFAAIIMLSAVSLAFAEEMTPHQKAVLDAVTKWKIANTLIFVVLLGYFLAKNGPRFFNARSADIQKAIKDATGLKIEADFRYSEIDRKMATLTEEVARLREQSDIEMQREHERLRHETDLEIAHIQHNVQAETEAFRLEGTNRIRVHTAQLALQLAERRLRERFAAEPHNFVSDFVHLVEQGKN